MGTSFNYSDFDIEQVFLDNTIQKMYSFENLEKGWDFGAGEPANKDVINTAIDIYNIGLANGFNVDAFPETMGGIVLNLFIDDNFIYVTINKDFSLDIRYEKGIGEDYEILYEKEKVSKHDIISFLKKINPSWLLLEPYTSENMTQIVNGLPAIYLTPMEGVSQHSMRGVPQQQAEQYVPIPKHFTTQQWETPFSFAE